jgi:hypothetical protein
MMPEPNSVHEVAASSGLATLTPMPLRRHLARWLDSPSMVQQEPRPPASRRPNRHSH